MKKNNLASFLENYIFLIISLLIFSGFFYYLSFVDLHKGDFYIANDEFMIPDSGIFMWYGLPARCMEWPAIPTQLFYYLLIAFLAVFNFLTAFFSGMSGIDFFDFFDKQVYDYLLNKPSYLVYGKWFQYFSVFILSILTYRNLFKNTFFQRPKYLPWIFLLLILTSHTVISTSSILRPDSIAMLLAAYLLSIIIGLEMASFKNLILLVLVFALLLSFRTIYLFLLPSILYIIFWKENKITFANQLAIIVLFIVFTLAFNPNILNFTFVFIKSFLGNIVGKRQAISESFYNWDFVKEQFSQNWAMPILIIFSIVGFYFALKQNVKLKTFFIVLGISIMLYLHSVLSSPTLFTTHLAPILPFFLFFVSYAFAFLSKNKIQFLGIFILLGIINIGVNYSLTRGRQAPNYFLAKNWIYTQKTSYQSIAIPEQLDVLFAKMRTKQSFENEFNLLNNEAKRERKISSLYQLRNTQKSSYQNLLLRNFMFDEENMKAAAAFICVQQTADNQSDKRNVVLFSDDVSADTSGIAPLQCYKFMELKPLFENNQIDYILSKNVLSSSDFKLIKKFDTGIGPIYYVYQNLQFIKKAN